MGCKLGLKSYQVQAHSPRQSSRFVCCVRPADLHALRAGRGCDVLSESSGGQVPDSDPERLAVNSVA